MFYVKLGFPFFVLGILGVLASGILFYVPVLAWIFLGSSRYSNWVCHQHQISLSWGKSFLIDMASFALGIFAAYIFS